jgi:hypothetical protein
VFGLPSTAADAGVLPFSTEEAIAGRFSTRLVAPQPARTKEPYTWNSHSEYQYAVCRAVPYIRTYRPVPVTARVCTPPEPVVVEYTVVQVEPLVETWIWNATA